MTLKHVTGLLCAAAMSLVLAAGARAEDKVVKIGAILPMSGGTASIGAHAKAALEVAMDIINNAHPELGNLPLAKNAGLAGLGGAKIEVVFADNQGSPATGQNQALRLITEEKVVADPRRLSVRHHADIERDCRKVRHSIPHAEVGRRQSHRARLQMVLPHHADRDGLRPHLRSSS